MGTRNMQKAIRDAQRESGLIRIGSRLRKDKPNNFEREYWDIVLVARKANQTKKK